GGSTLTPAPVSMSCPSSLMRVMRALFFFSSRRRHTRWPRDWSSDVCSSDLEAPRQEEQPKETQPSQEDGRPARVEQPTTGRVKRSEERRVGKECRARWSPYG